MHFQSLSYRTSWSSWRKRRRIACGWWSSVTLPTGRGCYRLWVKSRANQANVGHWISFIPQSQHWASLEDRTSSPTDELKTSLRTLYKLSACFCDLSPKDGQRDLDMTKTKRRLELKISTSRVILLSRNGTLLKAQEYVSGSHAFWYEYV